METTIFVLELIGIVAAAISGATVAIKKEMDLFGIVILGLITAVGGGVMRDLILGRTPPIIFKYPVYAFTAIITSCIILIPIIERTIKKEQKFFDILMLLMDSLGLGAFTVVGARAAYTVFENPSAYLAIFVGVITGVGGGVMRDMLSGQIPQIFVKHFYAIPTILGATLYVITWEVTHNVISVYISVITIVLLRLIAAKFHWGLPKHKV